MHKQRLALTLALALSSFPIARAADPKDAPQTWNFAVSGDSRNCGDVVMPAIAADALKHNVAFYWHLGDLRAIYGPDQDFIEEKSREGQPTDLADYEKQAWDDFIENQIKPWGEVPFYVGIGNHETTPPKTRAEFVHHFHEYLDRPDLKEQRLKDDPKATQPKTYFHWMRDGIDFIYLDNATHDQFDPSQMKWIEGVLNRDRKDDSIHTIVVGMHEALPESISANHSMNESPIGIESGRRVYHMLRKLQKCSDRIAGFLRVSSCPSWLKDMSAWLAGGLRLPVNPNVVHQHSLRESRGFIRIARPLATDRQVEDHKKGMVIRPLRSGRKIGGSASSIQVVIDVKADLLRLPLGGKDVVIIC